MELNVTIDEFNEELLDRISIYYPKEKPKLYKLIEINEPASIHPEEPEGQEEIMKQMAEALRSITTSSRAILGGISKDLMYEVETALAAYDSLTRKK